MIARDSGMGSSRTGQASPSSTERRERNAPATRQRILDSAEREFATLGFAGARLRVVADAAGVQTALIHHYFVDKQGLYRAVLDRALVEAGDLSWNLLERRTDLEGLVAGFVDILVDFYSAHANLLQILRHEALSGNAIAGPVLRERMKPIFDAVRTLIEARQASGDLRSDIPADEMMLATISMAVHPLAEEAFLQNVLPSCSAAREGAMARRKRAITTIVLQGLRR